MSQAPSKQSKLYKYLQQNPDEDTYRRIVELPPVLNTLSFIVVQLVPFLQIPKKIRF